MRPRYAIVGPPRSGTGYAAALLTAAGLDCGHEDYWHLGDPPAVARRGDASWLALPRLEADRSGVTVFALLRDPRDVVASLAYGELWTPAARRYRRFAFDHLGRLPAGDDLRSRIGWSAELAAEWTVRTLAIADRVLDVDVLHPDQVAGPLGYEPVPVAQYPPADTNTRGVHPDLTWDDLGRSGEVLRTLWDRR